MLEKQWALAENHRLRQHKNRSVINLFSADMPNSESFEKLITSLNYKYLKMGKKHVIEENKEEAIKEQEKVDKAVGKEVKVKSIAGGVQEGKVYVSSSYNNTILTLTNSKGQVLAWKSAGSVGFKGTKKSTSFAASRVAETIANACKKMGIDRIEVLIKGIGAGRESAVRSLVTQGLNVVSIKDVTPIPHNGCRPKKVRRV